MDFQNIAQKETVGFYLLPNCTPYLKNVQSSEVPEDMSRVLIRARKQGNLKLGVELSGEDAAKLLKSLYEKYNDIEHNRKRAIVDAKDKADAKKRFENQDEW